MTNKPAVSKDTIYVDADDEITAIIDKVENAKHKIVALVLPKRSSVFQSIVNMRLLAKSAGKAEKSLVLITSEHTLLPLAGAAGIHVAKNLHGHPEIPPSPELHEGTKVQFDEDSAAIGDKEAKLDYHRSIGELAAGAGLDDTESIDLEDDEVPAEGEHKAGGVKTPKDKKLKVPNFDKFRLLLGAGVLGVILLLFFLIFGLVVWPKAKITLKTDSLPLTSQFNLKTSDTAKSYDEAAGVIPAELKTKDQTATQQVQATGQQNLGEKAKGALALKNCTGSAVTVPAGAGVNSSGLTFITQKNLSLDSGNFDIGGNCKSSGGHIGNVDIVAQQGGSKYNLGSGQSFTVSGQPSGVSGSNSSGFSGGTDNNVTVVSQQDIDKAKDKITGADSDGFKKDFQKQLEDQGFYVLSTTLKSNEPAVTASPAAGAQASASTVTIKVTHSVLAVKKDELTKAINNKLDKQIDKNKQKLSSDDVLKDTSVSVLEQSSPTIANLRLEVNTNVIPIIDVASVQKDVAGKKSGEISKLLSSYPGVQSVNVDFSPFWVSKAPKKTSKITVVQEQVKANP